MAEFYLKRNFGTSSIYNMNFTFRKSFIDPRFLELLEGSEVVQEVEGVLRKKPPLFATQEDAFVWLKETEYRSAKELAYRWLAARSLSKKALSDKLHIKRFASSLIEQVVKEIEALGYLNDAEYYSRAIEALLQKGYGSKYIAQKLGLELHVVRQTLGKKEEIACRKMAKKYKDKRQRVQALLRKGFSSQLIFSVEDFSWQD